LFASGGFLNLEAECAQGSVKGSTNRGLIINNQHFTWQ
jgi:hypothetical protein